MSASDFGDKCEFAVVDGCLYRGYLIKLAVVGGLWDFTAQPATPDLPILQKSIYRPRTSRDAALAEARKHIDYLLAI